MLAGLTALLASLASAAAVPVSEEVFARFARGAYLESAAFAEQSGDAEGLAFAARSLLAACMTGEGEPDPGMLDRAQALAQAALARAPESADARLQLAIAVSLKSRAMDMFDALDAGYADDGKRLALEALQRDPANPYVRGFLAVWNIEVRRRGGVIGAEFMGASLENARILYREAAELAAGDVGVHWQYARALAAFELRSHREEVSAALARALAVRPDNHLEQVMQARARQLAEAIARGDLSDAQDLAKRLL